MVEISNVAGSIQVTGWDKSTVSVHGELGGSVERVDVTSQAGRTSIKVVLPEQGKSAQGEVVWRGHEAWDVGIALTKPDPSFWGVKI